MRVSHISPPTRASALPRTFRAWDTSVACGLMLSGVLHLVAWQVSGQSWEGPLSLRKPALFGISGGLTLLSIRWVVSRLRPRPEDRFLLWLTASLMLTEVSVITIQCWRGVPSHFNRSTPWDALLEDIMLLCISALTAFIVWFGIRSWRLPDVNRADRAALQGGLWLLIVSCGLGFVATRFGSINITAGQTPEIWGSAGQLKFPHGAALHAIQLLPAVSWIARRCCIDRPERLVWSAFWSQLVFLLYALRQTFQGRSRFDYDSWGLLLLFTSMALLVVHAVVVVWVILQKRSHNTDQLNQARGSPSTLGN